MKIKALLFDADQTLFNFKKAEEVAFHKTMQEASLLDSDELYQRYSQINDAMWKKLERNEIGKTELRVERFRLYFEETKQIANQQHISTIFTDHLSLQGILFEDAIPLVSRCALKVNCYIASNGIGYVQRTRFAASNLQPYIKDLFISEELKAEKPSVDFFKPIFEKLNAEPHEVAIVGDSLTADIQGGFNAGCITVWFNPEQVENHTKIKPDYEITQLQEVYDLFF